MAEPAMREAEREEMSPQEKKRELYERQKELLDTFLFCGAITAAQYHKSLGDLTEKMGFGEHPPETQK